MMMMIMMWAAFDQGLFTAGFSTVGWNVRECVQCPLWKWNLCVCVRLQDGKRSFSDTSWELCGQALQSHGHQVLPRTHKYWTPFCAQLHSYENNLHNSLTFSQLLSVTRWHIHEQWWEMEEAATLRFIYITHLWTGQKHHGTVHLWGDPSPAGGDREWKRWTTRKRMKLLLLLQCEHL